ncbi:hypothetical protein IID04_05405, partial [PVC group bacterium]|nr:hypothetical protein [PVC group bacterium]
MVEKINKGSSVIRVLARIVAQYPRDEKILITPGFQIGSQILEELTRSGTPWMNFRSMTMYALARQSAELVSGEVLTEVGMKTILDTVLTQLDQTKKLKYFQKRSINKGMIDHLADTIRELKTLGIQPDYLSPKHFVDVRKAADLKHIYTAYQIILNNKNLLDSADIWIMALKNSLKQKKRPKVKYIILAGCYANVTQKDFIKALAGADLIVIEEEPVEGLIPPKSIWAHTKDHDYPAPETDIERLRWVFDCEQAPKPFGDDSIELFRAAGSRNEISEVMRRIAAENLPADQVEIIYTDAHNYVSAIHAFSERVGIPVTFADGLPSYFSTPGRVLAGILMWIQEDFSEIYLRRLLKSGDLFLDTYGDSVDRADLAYLLRTSGVGWGRDRYDRILKQRAEAARKKSDLAKKENEPVKADLSTQEAEAVETLHRICMDLFSFIPDQDDKGQIDFAKLCVGCVDIILKFVRIRDERDNVFAKAATDIFNMLSRIAKEKMPVTEAIDKLLRVITRNRYGD